MKLRSSSDVLMIFIFIICVGGTFCLNEHREDIITNPTAVHCTKNPCTNGTCFVVTLPGTNENSEVECAGKSCFKYVFEVLTRENASVKCRSMDGELASFDTSEKLDLLKKSTRSGELHYNFPAVFWTSGKQSSNEAWSWGSKKPIVNSTFISNLKQSGHEHSEACLQAQAAAELGTSEGLNWIPANCALESYYICEIDQSIILQERTYQCRCDGDDYGVNCTYKNTNELKEKITCEKDTMELVCSNDTFISVDKVLYGKSTVTPISYNCRNETDEHKIPKFCVGSLTASLIVNELCHRRNICKFTVNEETLGTISCYHELPEDKDYYAKVGYFCKDVKETQYRRYVNCGYDKDAEYPVYFSCHQDMAIHVQYAYFGEMTHSCGNAEEDFFKDDYKDGCSSLYFLEYLVKRCNGKTKCSFVKDSELMRYRCEEPPDKTSEFVFVDVRYICLNQNEETSGIDTYSTFQRKNCMNTYEEGLMWPDTIAGVEHVQSCPDGQSGSATWMCTVTDGQWHDDGPDLSQCVPQWIDEYSMQIPESHEDALRYITIIGCSISIVVLFACIFVFSILKRLRSLRTTIHRNVCISLATSQFIFIVGVERTENKVICSVIAGVLHYSFLVSFMWMCLEGIYLYVTLVRVFNAEDHGVLQYYMIAYALPLLIVVALAGSVPEGYGTDKYCWLSTENNFILAFAPPVAVIIMVNLVILVVSLRKAYATSKALKQEATRTQQLRTWVKGAITLLFLLGSTWATGLFSKSSVFMAYIFTILNSLQGVFIFLFYCFNNDTVKKETKRWLSQKRWIPKKIRELLKETPKTTSKGNTLSSNVDQIETTKKTEPSATIMNRYSEDYTISSLFYPATIDYSMTSYTNVDNINNMPPLLDITKRP